MLHVGFTLTCAWVFVGLICYVSEHDMINFEMNLRIGSNIFTVLPFIHRAMCAQWITRLCLHGQFPPWPSDPLDCMYVILMQLPIGVWQQLREIGRNQQVVC